MHISDRYITPDKIWGTVTYWKSFCASHAVETDHNSAQITILLPHKQSMMGEGYIELLS